MSAVGFIGLGRSCTSPPESLVRRGAYAQGHPPCALAKSGVE